MPLKIPPLLDRLIQLLVRVQWLEGHNCILQQASLEPKSAPGECDQVLDVIPNPSPSGAVFLGSANGAPMGLILHVLRRRARASPFAAMFQPFGPAKCSPLFLFCEHQYQSMRIGKLRVPLWPLPRRGRIPQRRAKPWFSRRDPKSEPQRGGLPRIGKERPDGAHSPCVAATCQGFALRCDVPALQACDARSTFSFLRTSISINANRQTPCATQAVAPKGLNPAAKGEALVLPT